MRQYAPAAADSSSRGGARIARMKLTQNNRLSVTLVLYLCTLVGLLTCGFHQGQMSSQHLSGAGVVFCNLGSDSLGRS